LAGAQRYQQRCTRRGKDIKPATVLLLTCVAFAAPAIAQAQTAGSTLVGVAEAELREVATGWSAKRQVLGRAVYNDQPRAERIGTVEDIIISPDKAVSYVIINAGGFIGAFKHDVAVPVEQLKDVGGRLVLPGATKEALKASPPFEYAAH
jgi:sporulation protein YlmC with PRC-barrel domain